MEEKNTSTNHKRKEEEEEEEIGSKVKKTKTKEETNIIIVREALEALNSAGISKAHEFISSQYFNHESQMDPFRSKLRGPDEFIDTVKNLRSAFADLHYEEQETVASGDTCNWKTCRKFLWHCSSNRTLYLLSSCTYTYNW